jgi:protein SCO1/2
MSAIFGRGMRASALIVMAAAGLGLSACGEQQAREKFQATDITAVDWGKDFDLTDHAGQRRRLADFRGKVTMLFFGFTHCPDMCPLTLAKMAQAVERLGDEGKRVQGLFVTLDPDRDTPEVLARYVPSFHPMFLGLYGSPQRIAATAREFKVFYALQPPNEHGFYTVDHQTAMFVFDTESRLRLYMSGDTTVSVIAHDLKVLLDETRA